MLAGIIAILGSGLLIWLLFRAVKSSPDAFSKENMGKSFTTLGILALLLIAVIGFVVMMLRK